MVNRTTDDIDLFAQSCTPVGSLSCRDEDHYPDVGFAGNGRVAKIVSHAAAEHLTPLTLEVR